HPISLESTPTCFRSSPRSHKGSRREESSPPSSQHPLPPHSNWHAPDQILLPMDRDGRHSLAQPFPIPLPTAGAHTIPAPEAPSHATVPSTSDRKTSPLTTSPSWGCSPDCEDCPHP